MCGLRKDCVGPDLGNKVSITFFGPKLQSQTISRDKLCKALLFKKFESKMTQGNENKNLYTLSDVNASILYNQSETQWS